MFQQIAAAADRSEVVNDCGGTEVESDYRKCKLIVELDRNQRAVEQQYTTRLFKMHGLVNYAKTDLLVGLPSSGLMKPADFFDALLA